MQVPGIPVGPDRNPVTPTLVWARNLTVFKEFCYRCRIDPHSRDVKWLSGSCQSGSYELLNAQRSLYEGHYFTHIAFIGADPRFISASLQSDPVWVLIENLRYLGRFEHAFVFSEVWDIVPNVQDPYGREW